MLTNLNILKFFRSLGRNLKYLPIDFIHRLSIIAIKSKVLEVNEMALEELVRIVIRFESMSSSVIGDFNLRYSIKISVSNGPVK